VVVAITNAGVASLLAVTADKIWVWLSCSRRTCRYFFPWHAAGPSDRCRTTRRSGWSGRCGVGHPGFPPGPFLYGPSKQQVECGGFSLGRFPVTNEQFVRFVREVGYTPPAGHPDGHLFLSHWRRGAVPRGLEKHPVVWVSLFDALAYCRWAGGMLPTEWMWEKAARGPEGRTHPWGEGGPVAGKAKLAQVAARATCPVGTFSKVRSPYGCEDLIGNVSEWCYPLPEGAPVGRFPPPWPDPPMVGRRGEPVYGVVRGACFLRGGTTTARSTYRRRLSVTRRNYWTGFRVASLLPCRPAG
jgi:formylglycine-generating enzyme required for sulfatase activity